jgi:hypothetical protein
MGSASHGLMVANSPRRRDREDRHIDQRIQNRDRDLADRRPGLHDPVRQAPGESPWK